MTHTHPSLTRIRDSERPGIDPPYDYPDYVGTRLRHPKEPLVVLPHTLGERTGPVYGDRPIGELDHDLTRQHAGTPLGQRIVVAGRVLGPHKPGSGEASQAPWGMRASGPAKPRQRTASSM
jgi:protocatechuate 3,4-dioxygenase beta subunit